MDTPPSRFFRRILPPRAALTALLATLLLAGPAHLALAQSSFYWNGGGADGNLTTGANWSGGAAPSNLQNYIHFAGTTRLAANNNFGNYGGGFQIFFDAGAGAFTLSGNAINFYDFNSVLPRIENDSTNLQTISIQQIDVEKNMTLYANTGNLLIACPIYLDLNTTLTSQTNSGTTVTINNKIDNGTGSVGAFAVTGSGSTILTGTNTYTGTTTISAGTLQLGDGTSGRDGSIAGTSIVNNSNLTYNLFGNSDYSGVIGGTGNVTKTGDGTLTFSGTGANTYTGTTTVTGGKLILNKTAGVNAIAGNITLGDGTGSDILQITASNQIADTSIITLGGTATLNRGWLQLNGKDETIGGLSSATAGAGLVANEGNSNSTLTLNVTSSQDFSGVIRNASSANGTLSLVKTGSGTQTLSGNNIYTGTTTISGGTLQIGNGGTTGNLSASSAITNNGTLSFNRTNTVTQGTDFASVIGGTGNLTQSGSGTLVLTGTNTYTGTTTISAGTLQLGDGTTGHDGSIASTSIVDNANLAYNLYASGNYSGAISGTGNLTKTGTATLTLSGATANTYTGTTTVSGGNGTIGLYLNKTGGNAISGNMILGEATGQTSGIVQLSASNQIADTSIVYMYGTVPNQRGTLHLGGNSETIGGLESLSANAGVVDNFVSGTSILTINATQGNSYDFGGILRDQTGTFSLAKTGAGTQVISGANNTYTGGTQINGGILQVAATRALGSTGNITFGGGSLQYSANATETDYSARFKNSSSAITLDTNGQNVTLANATDSSNTGGLTKNGNGTLTLSGTNTYTGTTTVAAGTLALTGSGSLANGAGGSRVNVSIGGIFDISGVTTGATVSMLSETGPSNGGSVKLGSKALTVNGGDASTMYHFNTLGLSGDTGSLTLNAANTSTTLRLYGASLYTGATTIQAGTLRIVSTTASSGYSLTGGSLTTESAANLSDAATVDITSGTFTVGASDTIGAISGSGGAIAIGSGLTLTTNTGNSTTFAGQITGATGALTKSGSGTLALSGNNTYSGSTAITGGKLQFSGTGNANSSTILLGNTSGSNNATLDLNGVNQTYGSAITVQAGSTGVLTINSLNASGTNTLSNTITLNAAATLSAAGGGTLLVNTITGVSTANTLTINGPGTVNLGGSVDNTNLSIAAASGTLILAKSNSGPGGSGAGVRSLGGTLTITGATVQLGGTGQGGSTTSVDQIYDNASVVLNSGTFDLNGRSETIGGFSGTGGTVTSSVAGNATLTVGGSGTFSGVIQNGSGTVSFTKTGDNTTTFNGATANTYTGTTTVSGGTSSFLDLGKTTGNAIAGNITVGVGAVAGAVRLQASDQIADTSIVSLDGNATSQRGVLRLNGFNETIGGLNSLITGGGGVDNFNNTNSTLTLNVASGTQAYSGQIRNTGGNSTGTLALIKTGAGTQILSSQSPVGNNSYSGGTQINGGTVQVAGTSALGTGNVTFGGGTLQYSANGTATDYSALFKNSASAIALDTNDQNVTLAGTIDSTNTGGLAKTGNGTLTFSGVSANTYTGTTTITGGTVALNKTAGVNAIAGNITLGDGTGADVLQLLASNQIADTSIITLAGAGVGNRGWLQLYGKDETIGGLSSATAGAGLVANEHSTANSTLTLNVAGSQDFSGLIRNANSANGTLSLVKTGSGTQTLSGNNTYSGTTTITSGTIQIGNGGTSGALSANSTITNNGILVFNRSDTVTAGTDFSGSPISGSGSIVQNGSGKLLLWSGNTFTGGVTVNSGTLGIWEGTGLGAVPGSPTTQLTFGGNSTLQFEQTPSNPLSANRRIAINPGVTATIDTQSYRPSIAGVISGATGALVKMGTGNLTLSGNNTYGGGTSVTAGTLTLGSATALGSTSAALTVNAATLNMNTYGTTVGALASSNGTFSGFNLGVSGNTLAASSATLSGTTYIGIIGTSVTGTGTSNVITSSGGGLTGTVQFAGAQDLAVPVNSLIVKNGSGTFYRATLNSTDAATQVIITGSVPIKVLSVMPLGASIMAGTSAQTSYDGGGFHTEMYQNLVNDGRFTPDFVGSSTNLQASINPTSPNLLTSAGQTNNEGHPGYTTSQILNNLNANDGTGGNNGGYWLAPGNGVNPNYVPLNVGGNDFTSSNYVDNLAINRYDAIISQLNTLRSGVDTLASNLMYRSDVGSYINTYFNPYVQGVVYNHVLAGQNVQFVDLYGLLTPNNSTYPDNPYISSDHVHPNQAGYNRMGDIFYSSTVYGAAYWTGSQSENWSTLNGTSTNWAMDSARTTDRQALLTDATANTYSNADVFFNGNASPLATTLGADTTVRSLNFAAGATGAVSIGGNNTLTIGSGGITMQQGTGAHTVSSNIALASDQTWGNVSSNNLTVSGSVSGSGNLTIVGSYTVYTGNSSSTIAPTTVTGTGAFVLSGNNTYTGATSVTGGTLVVNGRLASPSVTVGAAGTIGGTGTIAGDTSIAGTHNPGNSPGIQTFAGNLTYSGGLSAVNWELAANSTTNAPNPNAIFDTVVVAGNLSFNGITKLNLSFKPVGGNVIWSDPFWQTSKSGTSGWLIYDVAGTIINFENLNLIAANWQDSGNNSFNSMLGGSSFSLYQSGSKIYLDYTSNTVTTPEPSSGVAMAVVAILGGAAFLIRRRRAQS